MRKERRQQRVEARRRFIVKYGVVGWGLTTGSLWLVVALFEDGLPSWGDWTAFFRVAVTAFVLYPLSGILFGMAMWRDDSVVSTKDKDDGGSKG